MNIFSTDGFLYRAMDMIAEIFILNLLFVICSIPIFTIGASTTALYYSMMKKTRRNEGYVYKNFLIAFKENFKQATVIWLILLALGFIIYTDIKIALLVPGLLGKIMIVTSIILLIPYIMTLTYIFPVVAKFENSIKNHLKNALLMSIAHLGYTLLILLFFIFFVFMTLRFKSFIGVMVIIGFGLYGFLTSNIFVTVFRKHLPEEVEDDAIASGIDNSTF